MHSTLLLTLAAAASLLTTPVLALPAAATSDNCQPRPSNHQTLTTSQLQTKQPTNALPANTNATLQYVALGLGIQNYSCASTTSAPKAIGAIATLFDATSYLQTCAHPASARLPRNYLKAYNALSCQASQDLDDSSCQQSANALSLDIIGHHYFGAVDGAASGIPFFDLTAEGTFLSAQKSGDVKAPANAFTGGKNGHGAVDWLFLTSDDSGRSSGLSEVYRINTAGGAPDPNGCASGADVLSYKYAAEYWFLL